MIYVGGVLLVVTLIMGVAFVLSLGRVSGRISALLLILIVVTGVAGNMMVLAKASAAPPPPALVVRTNT